MSVFRMVNEGTAPGRRFRREATDGRVGRTRALLAALALVLTAVPFMAASVASGAPTTPAHSGALNAGGFPLWFQDVNGVRVEPCLDPALTNCLAPIANPGVYDPAQPLSFPGNYPDEFFYSAVDSQPLTLADCAAAGGDVSVHLALEAAFLNGDPAPGDQMVFGRIRMRAGAGSGLCGSTWYTFRTPYGPVTIQTEADGTILGAAAAAATVDIGCSPTATAPCNYDQTLTAPVLQLGLLQQAVGAAPGYLGDGTFAPVVGSTSGFNQFDVVRWPAGVTPARPGFGTDCLDLGCTVSGSTSNFAVLAKLAGPLASPASSVDFGGQEAGTTSAARTVDLTNLGSGPLGLDATTIDDVTISGTGFALSGTSCSVGTLVPPPDAATPMARDASCFVDVTFTPGAEGVHTGSLDVFVNGSPTPFSVALTGTGILAGQTSGIATDPEGNVLFGEVRLLTAGVIHTITVTNTGAAPLLAVPSVVPSADSAAFQLTTNTCVGAFVPAGGTCTVGVRLVPARTGIYSELLQIATNTPGGTHLLSLNGVATGGIAAVSTTVDPVNTFPDWYQDEKGVRVGQCADPFNPLCVTAPVAPPVAFPTNYPDEWFYYVANSAPMDVADPVCQLEPGGLMVEAATEAAFLGPIAANEGITFGRLRFVSRGGLCPETDYVFTHPYGITVMRTDAAGNIKPAAGTTDVGCAFVPCDYMAALASPVSEGYLEQTVHPAGWLGDPVAPSTVTGSPYVDPATGLPTNYFNVQRADTFGQPGSIFAETDQFTVSGRLVGPMVAAPGALTFVPSEAGIASEATTQTVTFTNNGIAPVTLTAGSPDATLPFTIDGANVADFTLVAGGTCATGTALQPGQSCAQPVQFLPLGTGTRAATLQLHHDGRNNPLAVPLSGVGNAPVGSAAFSAAPAAVTFTDLHIAGASESQAVTISNVGGQATLEVGVPTVTGPFEITGNTCTTLVQPNAVCTVSVRFAPTVVGVAGGTLTVPGGTFAGAPLPTLAVALSGKGVDAVPAQSATTTAGGFPSWFQDANGVRLEQCMSNDGNCVLLGDATFNPALPVAFPSNYPSESFYSIVDSDLLSYGPQSCADGSTSAGGFALLRVATEAAFTTPAPEPGAQTVFNRIRIVVGGLCANTTYQFVHPYGVSLLTTDGNGDIRPKDGTVDTDNVTGSEPVLTGVLQWDPNVAPAAPAGYLGDARTFHEVVGSQYRDGLSTEPTNFFRIDGPSGVVGQVDRFLVAGRLAGPVVSSLQSKDFGTVEVGHETAPQRFTITNIGSTPVSAIAVTPSGADAALFTITSDTCSAVGLTLGTDESCYLEVKFAPTVAAGPGAKSATISVTHDGLRSPVGLALTGTAVPTQTPALGATPSSVAFGSIIVNTSSTISVQVKNVGTGPLSLGAIGIAGAGAARFSVTGGTCVAGTTTLDPGTLCTVSVRFLPTAKATSSATLTVAATDASTLEGHVPVAVSPLNVALSGTGIQGTISLSATTVNISARAGETKTAKLTLTNTGNAPFSLVGNPALLFAAVSANNPVVKFTATQAGCNNVAVGKNCQVTISFAPGAGTVNQVYSVDLYMFSNASNTVVDPRNGATVSGVKVRVNGTRAR